MRPPQAVIPPMSSDISPIYDIIADIRAGKMVILVDEEDRENEGRPGFRRRPRHPGSDQFHGQSGAAG